MLYRNYISLFFWKICAFLFFKNIFRIFTNFFWDFFYRIYSRKLSSLNNFTRNKVFNSASILTRSKHPIVPRWYILFNIFGKTWNINTQIFWGVLGRDNIPKNKYFYIWSTFRKNMFSWKIRNFQNPSYTQKFLYTYLS
jgi:hypothetical protein